MKRAVKRIAKRGRKVLLRRRKDNNQRAIVDALRSAGATVEVLDPPLPDLLIGWRGRNLLAEVKNPETRYGRGKTDNAAQTQEHQREWREAWKGKAHLVSSIDEALALIATRPSHAHVTPPPEEREYAHLDNADVVPAP